MKISFFPILSLLVVLMSCHTAGPTPPAGQLMVSIAPQKKVIGSVAGNQWQVNVLMPPGSNHESWEPAPADLRLLSRSKALFITGHLDFELAWKDRFQSVNREMPIVNCSEGFNLIPLHGHEGMEGFDPHTWLCPSGLKAQVNIAAQTLAQLAPGEASAFAERQQAYTQRIDSVSNIIQQILDKAKVKSFLVYHPSLSYFAREFGLEQISIEQDGKEPSPGHLLETIQVVKQKNIHVLLISKEFDTRYAEAIARETGTKIVVFDPMEPDVLSNLIQLSQIIASQ